MSLDDELSKAFKELHQKTASKSERVLSTNVQIAELKMSHARAKITERELSTFSPDIKVYDSVGRMFILTDIETMKVNLKNRYTTATEKIAALEAQKEYIDKDILEVKEKIRDMLAQH